MKPHRMALLCAALGLSLCAGSAFADDDDDDDFPEWECWVKPPDLYAIGACESTGWTLGWRFAMSAHMQSHLECTYWIGSVEVNTFKARNTNDVGLLSGETSSTVFHLDDYGYMLSQQHHYEATLISDFVLFGYSFPHEVRCEMRSLIFYMVGNNIIHAEESVKSGVYMPQ